MAVPNNPKITDFDVLQPIYKQVGDHGIRADILNPKTAHSGARPVIVRFHGGGFLFGDSLYMDWWPEWLSDLALRYEAVIVSPNYRLLPEATSPELYADIEDFWTWLHSPELANLVATHSNGTRLDTSRIITAGDSAGGMLSLYIALWHPTEIRAATASYPMAYPAADAFAIPRNADALPFGQAIPKSVVDNFLNAAEHGTAVSSRTDQGALGVMLAAAQHGSILPMYERDIADSPRDVLYPHLKLEQLSLQIPRGGISVIHGRDDSIVPVADTEKFISRAQELTKGLPGHEGVKLTIRDGEHGFDGGARLDDTWLTEALHFAVQKWLE